MPFTQPITFPFTRIIEPKKQDVFAQYAMDQNNLADQLFGRGSTTDKLFFGCA